MNDLDLRRFGSAVSRRHKMTCLLHKTTQKNTSKCKIIMYIMHSAIG